MCGLKMLFLLLCCIIAGIMALDLPQMHYRAINGSLCLQIRNLASRTVDRWTFNDDQVIILYDKATPNYKNRVDYNPNNFSLCIKNLTMEDSGTYEVTLLDSKFKISKLTHKLIVQGAVPIPVIRISVKHSNLSAGFCNFSVNCSVQRDWAQSTCDDDGCRNSQRSFSGVNITISAHNRSVFCSGSNYVSTSNISKSVEALCSNKSNSEHEDILQPSVIIVAAAVMAGLACGLLCALVLVCKRHFSTQSNQHGTSPDQSTAHQQIKAPAPRVSTSSSSEAEVSYENVDARRPGQISSLREELASNQSQNVDTVYSSVQRPNGTANVGKSDSANKDGNDHVRTPEASQFITLNETEQQEHVDTVYCLLQKPQNKN